MGCSCGKKDPTEPTDQEQFKAAGPNSVPAGRKQNNTKPAGGERMTGYPPDYDPPLPSEIVGTFSNHGIEHDYQFNAVVKINQDRGSVDSPFIGGDRSALFCVMDGHGKHGDKVSEYCIMNLHEYLYQNESDLLSDPNKTLIEAYDRVDEALESESSIDSLHSGTSAVTVYLRDKKLFIANAGDSRAVLASTRQVFDLSQDQNPDTPGERDRLEQRGGLVAEPEEEGLSARVWAPDLTIGLSMARSLGDHKLSFYGVIPTPVITTHDITDEDSVLILSLIHISEPTRLLSISYAVFCLKKKKKYK
eukprot:TRINITY_DN17767_c0_g1_i4.p1 TRINITY_DN17767_c0_g1~~TRINITY_DN17767_c0_g1_i4.p1  ORF type:complete len:305 (-),score=68.12 TRINITY_DN17767_c0_g1_i4:65-979(-)